MTASRPACRIARATRAARAVPLRISVNPAGLVGGIGTGSCNVAIQEVPPEGGTVLVSCDYPNVLRSPSGSWPYPLQFPAGGPNSRDFKVTAASVGATTLVRIYACEEGLDISNPVNWQEITTCTVSAQPMSGRRRLGPGAQETHSIADTGCHIR